MSEQNSNTTQVAAIQRNELSAVSEAELVGFLDSMGLTPLLKENEKKQFIQISKAFGLNPFKREIYCVKYKEDSALSIIVGYETYIKRAERSGMLDGWHVSFSGTGKDLKATITIHRKDRKHPFIHDVDYTEYVQMTNQGQPNKFWKEKPKTMLRKVAIAQGFRLCFSDELGGMPYTKEEFVTEEAAFEVLEQSAPSESEIKATVMPETIVKKPLTEESLNKYLARINAGEGGILENIKIYFTATEKQLESLKLAEHDRLHKSTNGATGEATK